jgi:uncharacterized protein (DUF362 family)
LTPGRRQFLQACLAGACSLRAWEAAGEARPQTLSPTAAKSKLVIARDPELRDGGRSVSPGRLLKLLDRALTTLYDAATPLEAWQRVVRPGQVVGLKVNCLAGRGISTSVALVEVVSERLRQAGVREIIVWDRLNSDLESAGFRIIERGAGLRCFGNDTAGYEDELATFGSVGSRMSRTLTRLCDVVLNLPVLKDHGITGVTMALKNMFGAIHNPNKYHLHVGDPYVADAFMLPPIRAKVRLHICDATTAQYEGGPSYMPQWTWPYNGLLVGLDPVALDTVGWQIIERQRAERGMKSLQELKREPTYIATAADRQHRLGTNDVNKIEVMEV